MSNYREMRRSEADWEQFSLDQREYIESLEMDRDSYKRSLEAELRVSRRLREHLDRMETEVQRLTNIIEMVPGGRAWLQ